MKSTGTERALSAPAPEQRRVPPESITEEEAAYAQSAEVETVETVEGAAGAAGAEVGVASGGPVLTERECEMLAFERKWWKHAGAKEQAIRDTFDLSATRYYQVLNALLDNPAALEHDPVVVGRLRRLRSTRTRGRATHPPS